MEMIITIISLTFAVASLAFAIYQHRSNIKSKRLMTNEALGLNKLSGIALGATQFAKGAIINNNSNLNAINEVGRAEGICDSILHESARLYCNLGQKTIDDIRIEINNGQLNPNYSNIYLSFAIKK